MSGVYIKGLPMPETGCISLHIYAGGIVNTANYGELEAIPVPDHGRLIDADALLDAWDDRHTIPSKAAKVIEKTMIPADKEEEK